MSDETFKEQLHSQYDMFVDDREWVAHKIAHLYHKENDGFMRVTADEESAIGFSGTDQGIHVMLMDVQKDEDGNKFVRINESIVLAVSGMIRSKLLAMADRAMGSENKREDVNTTEPHEGMFA